MPPTATILIVDDLPISQQTMGELLRSADYQLVFASDGYEALAKAKQLTPDLVLLDVMMPGMDGYEVCRQLRADPLLAEIVIIMVTALDDRQSRMLGIEAGADDFISKPFDRGELRARVRTITRLNRYRRLHAERIKFERLIELSPDGVLIIDAESRVQLANPALRRLLCENQIDDLIGRSFLSFVAPEFAEHCVGCLRALFDGSGQAVRVETVLKRCNGGRVPVEINAGFCTFDGQPAAQVLLRDITERKQAEAQIRLLHGELLQAYDATLEGWSHVLDLRDRETEGHSRRVTTMTVRLAEALGIEGDELIHIRRGALLHDIGKMGIPDRILLKPGALTPEEWTIMRLHPVYAYEWLSDIAFLRPALDIPHCHHERWDGSGYPRGLRGEEIPLAARLFAVADTWDAICSDRPYRAGRAPEQARQIIASLAGNQLDPRVVQLFLEIFKDL